MQCARHRAPLSTAAPRPVAAERRLSAGSTHRTRCVVAFSSKQRPTPQLDSDASFLARLAVGSAVGAVVVKYGSLVTDALFHPSATAAAALVVAPVVLYGCVLAARGLHSGGST